DLLVPPEHAVSLMSENRQWLCAVFRYRSHANLVEEGRPVGRIRVSLILFLLLGAAAVLAPGSARPSTTATQLNGSVGPGFVITLKDANGNLVSHLDPGAYTITVQNLSDPGTGVVHNFHLMGPGNVNTATPGAPGTTTFDVTLVNGTYTYLCDF